MSEALSCEYRLIDTGKSLFFDHRDPAMVEWFVQMVEQRKKSNDCTKEKKSW